MKRIWLLIGLGLLLSTGVHAQTDTALITALLKDIEASQCSRDGEFYTGMFPAYRQCAGFPHNYQPDNNIFFTAITSFTIKNLVPFLQGDNKTRAEQISYRAALAYPHYRNTNGKPFYSFWPTGARILPHAYFINRLNGVLAQGDDADDSVMILLSDENDSSANKQLKQQLIQVSNLKKRRINSTFKKYRSIPAYSTYLGSKMHPDFDFAVQCNVMYFNLEKKLPLVAADSTTILLLAAVLKNREYITRPVYVAPSYGQPSVLIYHISRLMDAFTIAELEPYRQQLVADAYRLLARATNIMDRIILRTSLLRLGAEVPELTVHAVKDFEASGQDAFSFFQARAAFAQPTPVKQVFLHWKYLVYTFHCTAYNKALLLEYLLLKNKHAITGH